MKAVWQTAVCVLVLFSCIPESYADWIRAFNASDGIRSAEATFTYDASDGKLTVDLANTNLNSSVTAGPDDNLTALFFSAGFDLTTTDGTAYVPDVGSIIKTDNSGNTITPWTSANWPNPGPPERSVGTEWAYNSGFVNPRDGSTQGISSAGLGLFGPGNRFETTYGGDILDNPDSPSGENFGLVPAGTTAVTGSLKEQLVIRNSVTFTFKVGDLSQKSNSFTKVGFLYGTSLLDAPYVPVPNVGVPEPSTLALLGIGAIGMLAYGWRRWKR